MASKTNCTINGTDYYKIKRKVGKKLNKAGHWVDDYKYFYGKNKSEAEAKYKRYKGNQIKGVTNKTFYFGEMADTFIKNVFLNDSRFSEATKERYVNAYNNNLQQSPIAKLPLEEVKSIDLQTVYNNLSCGASTVRSINNLLHHFFKYLEKEHICKDITENIVLPKITNRKGNVVSDGDIEVWTSTELKKIIEGPNKHRLRLLLILAINTGGRIGELLALRYDDIENNLIKINKQVAIHPVFKDGKKSGQKLEITQTKTKTSVRSIPLPNNVLKEIEEHKKWHTEEMMKNGYRTEYMFTTQSGKFYDKHSLRTACNRLYKRIGVTSRSFHVYRHTFGTNLAKAGVPIQTVSNLMGHSDINVTAKYYINVDNSDKQDAIDKITAIVF